MKKKKPGFPVKIISFIIVTLLILALAFISMWQVMPKFDYFKIKELIILGARDNGGLEYLKGANIWKLDLKKESRRLSLFYPAYEKVYLSRVLPNRLFVIFKKRTPLALIKLTRYFYVDNEQVLFDILERPEDVDLPVIYGLGAKIIAPGSGKRYNVPELDLALKIIKEFRKNNSLSGLKIRRVDVGSASSASFFISEHLEVKIGQEDIAGRLGILSSLISESGKDVINIKYIDLRFQDPVVKLR